ncbi:MAG: DNA polymerase III subunit beta [Kiritimatiellae bacterium]|nr:DNA polymerase III subunit beta [Kiritimatiellia bacterium]MBR1836446.1 DNA polymerase III subunit beta [Kiritimatiellia bacterium]
MKFKIHQANLLEALVAVQGVVGSRVTLPVLSNVLVEAEGETLRFTTTDFTVAKRFSCKAEIEEPGAVTLPVKRLAAIVRELSDQIVEVSTDKKRPDAVRMVCGSYRSTIAGIAASEFPKIPSTEGGLAFTLPQATLKEMLRKTSYAAAADDASRPVLTGTLLSFADGKATCVATDGRRLALVWAEVEFPPENARDVVLSPRTVAELLRSLGDEGDVRATLKETQIVFEFGSLYFSSKLLNGTYPNYKQVVVTDRENKIRVGRDDLLAVLRRINVSTTPTTNAMRLTFENNLLSIAVNAPDVEEATDTVAIKYDGPAITAMFNPEYMMEPLKSLSSDEICIELNNGTSPGLIKDDTTFLYVIMPLRI